MKQLFSLFLLVLFSCNMNNTNTIDTVKQDANEIDAIKKVLTTQQKCWNEGDIKGFMEGYWNSEKLIFTSAEHMPSYGWKNTFERYKSSYPTKESMGVLKFEILNLKLNTKNTALLKGKWELFRKKDHPSGIFWLDLQKFENNWLIIKDSTITIINSTIPLD